jgi:hypothetical protein
VLIDPLHGNETSRAAAAIVLHDKGFLPEDWVVTARSPLKVLRLNDDPAAWFTTGHWPGPSPAPAGRASRAP